MGIADFLGRGLIQIHTSRICMIRVIISILFWIIDAFPVLIVESVWKVGFSLRKKIRKEDYFL